MKTIKNIFLGIIFLALIGFLAIGALACGFAAGSCSPISWWLN